jgi:hypothetical protein
MGHDGAGKLGAKIHMTVPLDAEATMFSTRTTSSSGPCLRFSAPARLSALTWRFTF